MKKILTLSIFMSIVGSACAHIEVDPELVKLFDQKRKEFLSAFYSEEGKLACKGVTAAVPGLGAYFYGRRIVKPSEEAVDFRKEALVDTVGVVSGLGVTALMLEKLSKFSTPVSRRLALLAYVPK